MLSSERRRTYALNCAPALRALMKRYQGAAFVHYAGEATDLDSLPEVAKRLDVPFEPHPDDQLNRLEERFEAAYGGSGMLPESVFVEEVGAFGVGASLHDALRAAGPGGHQAPSTADEVGGRMAGKIIIVTGGAQGFGRGIAEGLLREGATVVIADINESQATDAASELGAAVQKDQVSAYRVDVTNEADVQKMIEDTVLRLGGLDAFISNAGILRAGSLEEMDVASFELVNRVNYTAFFIGTKYACRPMKTQHRFNAGMYGDIIQINSKSGLSGSNKNFAYAGSKFGSIGLTQSFALELVPHNIKVNAVCPGNLFDGPLWSDPERGLFRQYLDTGKVPGARTIDDVRRAYEEKVPMRRGCRTEDVTRAVMYAIEQEYETGQAIPVTGGQIMLK